MSNIEDVRETPSRNSAPPDSLVPAVDPVDALVEADDVKEPGDPAPPVEQDPEEGRTPAPSDIERV